MRNQSFACLVLLWAGVAVGQTAPTETDLKASYCSAVIEGGIETMKRGLEEHPNLGYVMAPEIKRQGDAPGST